MCVDPTFVGFAWFVGVAEENAFHQVEGVHSEAVEQKTWTAKHMQHMQTISVHFYTVSILLQRVASESLHTVNRTANQFSTLLYSLSFITKSCFWKFTYCKQESKPVQYTFIQSQFYYKELLLEVYIL